MERPDWKSALGEALAQAVSYLDGLPDRPVHPAADLAQLRAALGGPLPERPLDARDVVADLAAAAGPGVIASGSGRFFGFVVGGATPAALAADWLASAWDQNAGLYVLGPAAAVVEEVAGAWAADLLGLPPHVSVGFVTGAQMANVTGLAAALHAVLGRAGWDVSSAGLWGAPRVRVLAGEQRHGTVDRALRFLGVGTAAIEPIPADAQGRMRVDALASAFDEARRPPGDRVRAGRQRQHRRGRPGRADQRHRPPARRVGARRRRVRAVGGGEPAAAAAAGRRRSRPTRGRPTRTSGSTCPTTAAWSSAPTRRRTGPRWARGRATWCTASAGERDALDYNPEHSRRARGFAVYAALRALGRGGVADLVERSCALARRFADAARRDPGRDGPERRGAQPGAGALPADRTGDSDDLTRAVVERVQHDGTCWCSGTVWQGRAAMRISVSNWSTDEADVDRSVAAILRCAREAA